jgi:tetratricopeptide (TPR) repeat protein|tara:strand:+ start:18 stop:605 length:588 start_codon:yes stop_codon:yes gene_type:complete
MGYNFSNFSINSTFLKLLIIIVLNFTFTTNSYSSDQRSELNKLFENLKNKDVSSSFDIEQKIWKIWSTHPKNDNLTKLLDKGSELVRKNKLFESVDIFTEVIELDPNWAEAWNKRATVYYLIGEFKKSQDDIDKVLELENRHFGALAGQGLVNIKLKNYEKAIRSYQRALEIYPSMQSPTIMIKEIEALIKEDLI